MQTGVSTAEQGVCFMLSLSLIWEIAPRSSSTLSSSKARHSSSSWNMVRRWRQQPRAAPCPRSNASPAEQHARRVRKVLLHGRSRHWLMSACAQPLLQQASTCDVLTTGCIDAR